MDRGDRRDRRDAKEGASPNFFAQSAQRQESVREIAWKTAAHKTMRVQPQKGEVSPLQCAETVDVVMK